MTDLANPAADDLDALRAETAARLAASPDLRAWDAVRVGVLGKSGSLTALLKGLGAVPAEQRKERGAALNRRPPRSRIHSPCRLRWTTSPGIRGVWPATTVTSIAWTFGGRRPSRAAAVRWLRKALGPSASWAAKRWPSGVSGAWAST